MSPAIWGALTSNGAGVPAGWPGSLLRSFPLVGVAQHGMTPLPLILLSHHTLGLLGWEQNNNHASQVYPAGMASTILLVSS